jgi:hypothetical protein
LINAAVQQSLKRKRIEAYMTTIPRTNREPAAPYAAEIKGVDETLSALYTNGIDRVAEVQQRAIDLAVAQNAELTETWKKIVQKIPGVPGLFMLDLAKSAFESYAGSQKSAIDMMVEQGHSLAGMAKDNVTAVSKATENVVGLVQKSVERAAAIQKKALDQTAAHTKVVLDTIKQQSGIASSPAVAAVDSFNRGVDAVIEVQKELLDIVAVH